MYLPQLRQGRRHIMPMPPSSADALLISRLALQQKEHDKRMVVVTADARDALRLLRELGFFAPQLRLALFPDWETLPYDSFSPHQDLISERLSTLWGILQNAVDVLFIPASTALYRLAPASFLAAHTFSLRKGQRIIENKLKDQLVMAGYQHVGQVIGPGEYAVRGSLIDLFPNGSLMPYRIDLFDDEIDSIRVFDPNSQRSQFPVADINLLPGREFPMDDSARILFRQRWRELLEGDPTKSQIYKDIGNGVATAGIEYYLPLFFEETATVFDYLDANTNLILHGDLEAAFQHFWQDAKDRHRLIAGNAAQPALPPNELFLQPEQFYILAKPLAQLALRASSDVQDKAVKNTELKSEIDFAKLPDLSVMRVADQPLARLQLHAQSSGARILVLAESEGRRESLSDFLRTNGVAVQVYDSLQSFIDSDAKGVGITISALQRGFSWLEGKIDFVTETELFDSEPAARKRRRHERQSNVENMVRDLAELRLGDPVVHAQYGVGRYRGLLEMDIGQKNPDGSPALQEFLHLEYASEAMLYVPVSQLQQISRYSGVSAENAPLNKLGTGQWDKSKRKTAEQVRDAAAELLNIYAIRAASEGFAFRLDSVAYEEFSSDFGFEESPDQQAAIDAVVQDMISPQPMDRLICGDVGFGKTEVALRAAFVAVMAGKQVAFLAPTTLLAEQHYQTLQDRFSKWPIRIAEVSRFRTTKEVNVAIDGLARGTVDIVIGTHKLLSSKIDFKNLGLLIIDEEHRFGVRHKEAMKQLRAHVDVLTLTATPIPRTLGMALEGLRDLSIIATAPQKRLSIKTFVRAEDHGVIREAVLRELKRGGQVYFLHNDVQSIERRQHSLQELLPEARIAIAHGQMPERELEKVMRDFVAQRHNLLLCSTIIETGIDVPSANTIVISQADRFGLAQLHQLRGRVGRSHHQAYAYLMVSDIQSLTKMAKQRLEAIQQMEELGSGFYLAMHDLEIRGAGDVLGENQSGNITEIGFQLYNEMLSQAVKALKEGKEPDLLGPMKAATEINLHVPALLPSDYCLDVQLRLSFYKRLASTHDLDHVDQLLEEIVDRFGKPPQQVQSLIATHRLRILCEPYGVSRLDAKPDFMVINFRPNPPFEPLKIVQLIQKNRHIKLAGNDKLRIEKALPELADRVHYVRDILRHLGQPLKQKA